jgi:hypothetical protein
MVTVKYDDLSIAFDFFSSAPQAENNAYISLDTGAIYWTSESNPVEEEVPDDLETSDRYVAIPHKNDLDLGRNLVLRFVAQELPEHYNRVEGFFQRKGAYRRFKDLLESQAVPEKWYAFEAESTERALRDWCAENGIQIVKSNDAA